MDLTTNYMGIELKNPLVLASSNLTSTAEKVKKYAESGVGAIVLKSLFEEQIVTNPDELKNQDEMYFWYPEAIDFISKQSKEQGLENYLDLIQKSKRTVDIPIIASINCISSKEWPSFAKEIQVAGADGIELNIGIPANELQVSANTISDTYMHIVKSVKKEIDIPVSVKIGYHFNNIVRMAFKLNSNGADSIVMFNRYYRPDIDIEKLNVVSKSIYSSPEEITIALRWIALTYQQLKCNLSASTGIHDYSGVVKSILCGASTAQLCSMVYKFGAESITKVLTELKIWMQTHNFSSINEFKGLLANSDEYRKWFERLQFMQKSVGVL